MDRFSKDAFLRRDDEGRRTLAIELGHALTERLRAATAHTEPRATASGPDPSVVGQLIGELRALGHDLWSFDESDEFQIWCSDWRKSSGPSIVVTFRNDEVTVEYSQQS